MKKAITLIAVMLLSLTALVSCGGDDVEIPDGMQLCYGSEADGYYFFAPEGWTLSNLGSIHAAYVSRVNTTSLSFAEIELGERENASDYFFGEYFEDSLEEFTLEPTFLTKEGGEAATLGTGDGAATRARKYIYKMNYQDVEHCFMQILAEHEGRYFIFTYSAISKAKDGEESYYDKYLDMAQSAIEGFRFVEGGAKPEGAVEYERDEDGFILISDRGLAGFKLYVPDDFSVDFSSAFVSATHGDGSNVNLTKATGTGVVAEQYWSMRREELEAFADELTTIREGEEAKLGNAGSTLYGDWCWCYEYTYLYNGTKFHVYQLLAINGSDGYVFTYTAKEENYAAHYADVEKIIAKVKF